MLKRIILFGLIIILVFHVKAFGDSFSDSDLNGDWSLKGKWYTIDYDSALADALIHIDGSNKNVTDGIWKIDTGATSEVIGSQAYMLADGSFVAEFTTEAFGPYDFQGVMNESKDVVVNTESVAQSEFSDNSLSFLVVNTNFSYSTDDFSSGTWDLRAMWGSGTVESDGSSRITGGSFVNYEGNNETVQSTSSYSIDDTYGKFEASLVTDSNLYELKGAMNGSKDFIPCVKIRELIEHLTNGDLDDLDTSSAWESGGVVDFTLSVADSNIQYSSTEGDGTSSFSQPEEQLAVPIVGGNSYNFTYTVSNTSGAGAASAYVSTSFASEQTDVDVDADGTYTTTITAADDPHDFTIVASVPDDEDDIAGETYSFTIDDLSLKENKDPESQYNLAVLVKSIGNSSEVTSYSESDFSGTWQVKGMNYTGHITSEGKGETADDGKGKIIGGTCNVTSSGGSTSTMTVTGDYYTINLDNGTFEAKIIAEDSEGGDETTYRLQGVMNESKDLIVCAIAPTNNPLYSGADWGDYYYNLVTLVKNYAKKQRVDKDEKDKVEITDSTHDLYKVYCDIPPGALSSDTSITIDEVETYPSLPTGTTQIGNVVDFGPIGQSFNSNVTLAITYPSDTKTEGIRAYKYTYDSTDEEWEWENISISSIDSSNNRVLISTSSFSIYALGTVEVIPTEDKNIFGYSDAAGTCFIATAAYGTPLAKEVKTLCKLRDKYLVHNKLGRVFINLYNRYSPPLADYIRDKKTLRFIVRAMLKPVIWGCKKTLH